MNDPMALYNTTPSHIKDRPFDYHIVHLLNPPLSSDSTLKKIYRSTFGEREPSEEMPLGPFCDIAELDRYCFKITQQFNLKGIGLLEIERYNRIVEEAHNLGELKTTLLKKCDYIENPDYRKTGILKRLLN